MNSRLWHYVPALIILILQCAIASIMHTNWKTWMGYGLLDIVLVAICEWKYRCAVSLRKEIETIRAAGRVEGGYEQQIARRSQK